MPLVHHDDPTHDVHAELRRLAGFLGETRSGAEAAATRRVPSRGRAEPLEHGRARREPAAP